MKKYIKGIIVAAVFSIFISSNLIEAYAGALNKEQTIIDTKNNQINIIDSKSIKKSIQMKDNSIFMNENGTAFIAMDCLTQILYERPLLYEYDKIKESAYIFDEKNSKDVAYIQIKMNPPMIYVQGNLVEFKEKQLQMESRVYLPLRELFNALGYSDDEIIFNSQFKTVTFNRNPIFETNTITVRDTVHYSSNSLENPGKTFSIADTEAIELLTKVLNEEPFYESDVAFSSAYSAYYLDFNNGVVLEVCDSKLSTCIIKIGHETIIYQIPFKASIAIEQFVRKNIHADIMNQNKEKWYYNIDNTEEMYYKEYISCDYFDDDYSQLIQYLETRIEDFSLKYSYKIQKDNSGIKIFFTSKENSFSVRIYESIGAIRSYVDAEIAGLE